MKKQVRTTGDHGMGQMVHVVHMSDDAQELREFYERVFGAFVYMGVDEPNYLPWEDRYATLLMIGDLCIETMAPRVPANPSLPVGKFYTKFGRHLHSVGYKVADLPGLTDRLLGKGIYIGGPAGGPLTTPDPETLYCFPSPRDTAGLMVELSKLDMPKDPRDLETWSSLARMWRDHPLTIERFSNVILGVGDLEAAVKTYRDVFQAIPVAGGTDRALEAEYQTLQLGDCLLQIAQPRDVDSDLARHVDRWGNMIYGLRFLVRDVDSAEAWLDKHDVRTTRLRADLIVTNAEDCFGAPVFLGSTEIDGDPFTVE
ncbi:VOC family protein [Streptomyces sp. NPDC057690]|uniref:VOC family protein n=1 Tax=Streptomyces sp. NPDC057690 TaxID=3346214 RepID=UPI0036A5563E